MDIGKLSYFILGEVVACILSLLLIVIILCSFSPYERKHRLFLYAGIASFGSAFFDILAVICISFYQQVPIAISSVTSILFFTFLLMLPLLLSDYAFEIACTYSGHQKIYYTINGIVYVFYFLLVITSPFTGLIFRYDEQLGYIRGPLKYLTYILTAFYTIMTVSAVLTHKNSMAKRVVVVFVVYPIVSILFVAVQLVFPKVLFTGVSSFSALLMSYITIQNDMHEFDSVTGLMMEKKLKKHLEIKSTKGILYIVSIENMNLMQNNLSAPELNQLLLEIGKEFSKIFERKSYHLTTDRFAAICENQEILEKKHEEIRDFFENMDNFLALGIPAPLEVYYAGIEFSDNEKTYSNIMEIANNLLVKAKFNQSDELLLCDESVLVDMERKRYIYKILQRELNVDSEMFQVWFQPIYSLKEKKFTYMEALSRLQNTEIGDIPPQEFVGVAERRGLIEKLGFVAFEKVCKFISENRNLVQAVSINFSVYQMTNPDVVNTVLNTIKRFNLEPQNIIMEITESIFIDDFDIVYKNMNELATAGVQFYLDDFGTGYSNLSNVVTLPFRTIKMDRTLVLMMDEGQKYVNLFTNLVSTFKGAGLKILVEGVETQQQDELVKRAGVDNIQGYLYSRPLPPEKCIELLKKQ